MRQLKPVASMALLMAMVDLKPLKYLKYHILIIIPSKTHSHSFSSSIRRSKGRINILIRLKYYNLTVDICIQMFNRAPHMIQFAFKQATTTFILERDQEEWHGIVQASNLTLPFIRLRVSPSEISNEMDMNATQQL